MDAHNDWRDDVDDLVADLLGPLGAVPFDPTPMGLYAADDLYGDVAALGFAGCRDQAIYRLARHAGKPPLGPVAALAHRLHDHGMTVALDEFRSGRSLAGLMGGHAMRRGSDGYRQAVACGRALALAGHCVVTGGGPGAMEAANFGAFSVHESQATVDELVDVLGQSPSFEEDVDGFIMAGLDVRARVKKAGVNLSLPTWFYGHEPSNPFATHIAKYFYNSEREDGLLAIAKAGIVFVQGGPGTIQEVFQDAAQNAYGTFGRPSPMVFLEPTDDPFWDRAGVMPVLDQAFSAHDGSRRPGWELISVATTVDEVVKRMPLRMWPEPDVS